MKPVFLFLLLVCTTYAKQEYDSDELRCLVCKDGLTELKKALKKIDPSKKVDVGGYRLDKDGNYVHKTVSQAKSEIHLSEVIETVCNAMDDYIRAKWKKDGTLTLLKLINDDGNMNSDMSEVDIIQDDDLNKSLKYICEGIMEEYEENLIKHIQEDDDDLQTSICTKEAGLCKAGPSKPTLNEEL